MRPFVLVAAASLTGCLAPASPSTGPAERDTPVVEADSPTWWCFEAQSTKGETFDHCLRVTAECQALVMQAQADERFVAGTPKCEPQALAHCMTTPRGKLYCMADSDSCDGAFKLSIAAVSGWWGAATTCTALRPNDTMPVTKMEPAFAGGDCIVAKDGYIWMITRVEDGEYFAMGWQGDGWGNVVGHEVGHFESLGYQPVDCPQKTL